MEYDIEKILTMYEDDYNPSSMVQGPRNMYAYGQLVSPSVDGSRPGYNGKKGPKKKPITFFSKDAQELIKDFGIEKYNKLSNNQQYAVRQGLYDVGTGSGRVLGDPITIDGKEYKKVLEGPDKGKYAIKEGTNNPRQFVKKSEIRKTVKANTEKGKQNLQDMYKERTVLNQRTTDNRSKWIKNWLNKNLNKYSVREFNNFQDDLLNDFNAEVKKNPNKYGTSRKDFLLTKDGFPVYGDSKIGGEIYDNISFTRAGADRNQLLSYQKIFFKNKLKDKDFRAKVNSYLDWNLTRKFEGGAGSMSKTAALDYGKLAKGFDDDLIYFMGEILNNRALNPGGGQTGIHDIFKKSMGKKADAYFKKYQGSWGRWKDNFDAVAKLAGLDQSQANALLQKQINDTQKIMKVYNVKKLPLEFMVAQDHLFGLAEAKALGDPKIAAQTLKNLVASTREQNRYLGQQGFSTKRKALINKFKKTPPNARGPIITELNALADEFVPGRLQYDVRKDGSLKITNLQPETTLKARASAYEGISKNFPKNIQKAMLQFAGTITDKCNLTKTKADGGRIGFQSGSADCLRIAKEGMDEGLTTGKWKSPDQAKMARNIAETAGKISKTGIGVRLLSELFGPVAIASLPVFEAGIASYDTITSGTPFKEAVNKTLLHYAAGDKWKADPEKLKRKDILNMADGPEKEVLIKHWGNIENLNRVMDNYKKKYNLEQDKEQYEMVDMTGYGDDGSAAAQAQKQIEAINNKILNDAAQGKDYNVLTAAVDDPYAKGLAESKEGELLASRDANSWSSRMFGTENPYYSSSNYRGKVDPDKIAAMKAKGPTYDQLNKWSPGASQDKGKYSRDEIINFLGTVPDIEITDENVDFLQTKLNADYFRDVLKQPGMLGTQYSEGGIASLNVNKK